MEEHLKKLKQTKEMSSSIKFLSFLKQNDINFYQVNSELKESVIERFNRTFKEKMWRYFTLKRSYNYIEIYKSILSAYNHSYHRKIKMAPFQVNKKNEHNIYETVFGSSTPINAFKLQKCDRVRISKYKSIFEKGYTPNWSEEIFTF